MGLIKNLENGSSIVLLYTNYFTWKDASKDDLIKGAPAIGKVYRALQDSTNNMYYVRLDETDNPSQTKVLGIRISNLKYTNKDFECDMVILNEDNITDYEISPEDYKQINKWVTEEHADFINLLEATPFVNVVVSQDDLTEEEANGAQEEDFREELAKKVMDAIKKNNMAIEKTASDAFDFIWERDPFLAEVIVDFLVYACKMIKKEDSGSTIPFSREISINEELGKGANIYTSISAIENYINNNKSIGGNKNSVNKALFHLMLELVRIKTNPK